MREKGAYIHLEYRDNTIYTVESTKTDNRQLAYPLNVVFPRMYRRALLSSFFDEIFTGLSPHYDITRDDM